MSKTSIFSSQAPPAIGPYSQAVLTGHLLFLSGQIGMDPTGQGLVEGGVLPQARQIFSNIKAIMKEAGAGLEQIVKVTVFLKRMDDFPVVNEEYKKHFSPPYPARSTVAVVELPLSADIEIEAVAVI